MDATHTPDPTAFPAPHVPLADDGGLGYNDIARTPDAYITVQVGPWDGFQDGDTVQIRWGVAGTVVGSRAASRGDQGKRLDVFVHAGDIRALGEETHEVVARVTHAAGTTIDSSPTHIRVKMTVPGGHDTSLKTPYTNEHLPAPEVSPSVITPETTDISVTIPPYPDMAAEDLILVRWNVAGNDVSHGPIEVGEVGEAIVVPIHEPTLRAGGAGGALNVSYQVFDRVHNWSLWSPRAQVEVEAPGAPTEPWVEGTFENAGEVLDVDALNNADVKVTVRAGQVGATDTVTVHWAGTTAAGLPLAFDTEPQVPQLGQSTLTFVVPYRWVEPLAQGTARAWYTAVPADRSAERSSLQHNLTVTGTVAQLIRPSIAEAKDETIDPADIDGSVAHALVPAWHGMQVGDIVKLVGDGTASSGNPLQWSEYQDVSSKMLNDDVAFDVPREFVTSLLGGHLRLHYVVTPYESLTIQGAVRRFALAALASDPLELEVRDASTVPMLKAPSIPELEAAGYLDPDKHTTAHVDVPVYTGIAKGDQIDLALQGGVTPYEDQMRVTSPTTPPRFTLAGEVIQANRGLVLTANYTVSRNEVTTGTSLPLSFRIGALTEELPLPTVDKANNGQLNPIDATADIVISVPPNAGIGKTDIVTLTITGLPTNTPPIPAIPGDPAGVVFRLPPSFFAGALGKEVSIHYSVAPATGDPSRTSPALTLSVLDFAANDTRVAKPTIDEASGSLLDMTKFAGNATVTVPAWPLMASGQRFWLRARSGAASWTIVDNRVIATPIPFKTALDRNWLTTLADKSQLTLELVIAFDGDAAGLLRTFTTAAYVVRTPPLPLAAPSILHESNDQLDVLNEVDGVVVMIPANAERSANDSVTVTIVGLLEGAPQTGSPDVMKVIFPQNTFASSLGKTLDFYYTVTSRSGGETPRVSAKTTVKILDFGSEDPRVPKPGFEESYGTMININTFRQNLHGFIKAWPMFAPGQKIWMRGRSGGYEAVIANGESASAGGFSGGIERRWLKELPKYSELKCEVKISFDGLGKDTAKTFTSGSYELIPEYRLPELRSAIGNQIPSNTWARIRVYPYGAAVRCDMITAYFGNYLVESRDYLQSEYMEFDVPQAVVASQSGRLVNVTYTIEHDGIVGTSPDLEIYVLP